METKPVWVYVIFRRNRCIGKPLRPRMTVNMSFDGPVFWNRQVVYAYCCSCHFDEHEPALLGILGKFAHRIERVCLVDTPVDYSFLPDHFFSFLADQCSRLEFIYIRELDLERINRGTVVKMANHPALKKVIVHGCRNYDAMQDFHSLPQLLVVKGEIQGLKVMLGDMMLDMDDSTTSVTTDDRSTSQVIGDGNPSEDSSSLLKTLSMSTATANNGTSAAHQDGERILNGNDNY